MMQHHNTGEESFWDIMRHRNPGQSLSAIWCRIITQDDAKLMLVFVNKTNTVISTKIWLLQTLKSVSTGLGQILHPFLSSFHICNQSNILKPSHITGTICLLEQFTIYPNQVSPIQTEAVQSSGSASPPPPKNKNNLCKPKTVKLEYWSGKR
jgi:hypothetical protein